MVGGMTPGKGGTKHPDPSSPACRSSTRCSRPRGKTGANATSIYVPPRFAADAILEAIDAEIPLIVCITEGIPVLDMVKVKRALDGSKSRLIGPNCPGVLTPNAVQDRHHAGQHLQARQRRHRLALRHAHLRGGEADDGCRPRPVDRVGIGGDPVKGTEFIDVLEMFLADPATNSIIMIGEIGGAAEEDAADFIKSRGQGGRKKPMAGFIAGMTAPPGRRMGHAGAIISGGKGKAEDKVEAMKSAGIAVADSPASLGTTLAKVLNGG